MNWFNEMFEKFRRQSMQVISITIFAKFLFGVGLGVLLVNYFQGFNWELYGWLLIIISLGLAIPSIYTLLIKR